MNKKETLIEIIFGLAVGFIGIETFLFDLLHFITEPNYYYLPNLVMSLAVLLILVVLGYGIIMRALDFKGNNE